MNKNKNHTPPDHIKILNVLYIIISLAAMAIFFFTSTARTDEYTAINSVALWSTILAALVAVALAVSIVLRSKK